MPSFSERHGFQIDVQPITNREEASDNIREMVVNLAERHGMSPSKIRRELCDLFMIAPDSGNWSEYPNIDSECRQLIGSCAWHEVFDAIEAVAKQLDPHKYNPDKAAAFSKDINRLFEREGSGWQLKDGLIVVRGSEPFNRLAADASEKLGSAGKGTAASEIHEALKDISRRPSPDKTGAIQHAMGAIECVVRSYVGDTRSTLGELIKSKAKSHGIPAPLDEAVTKIWGYASERARHLREGNEPSFEEAELIVTVSAAICVYLSSKTRTR